MKITNSYIFLTKESEIKKGKDNNLYITLKDSPPTIIKKLFNAIDNDIMLGELEKSNNNIEEKLQDLIYKTIKGKFILTLSDKTSEINYKFIEVNTTYYLDVIINCEKSTALLF